MTEREKLKAGYLYNPFSEKELPELHTRCMELCFDFNNCRPSDTERQKAILREMIGDIKENTVITQPFYCDYGVNIHIGENFYSNYNLVILDCVDVRFGNNVFIAPNCVFTTAGHPIDSEQRDRYLEYAYPITVGDSVWFGTNVSVLPGVTIGSNVVIGAGSVVNRDIPDGVVAAGNPCRVIRKITEEDKSRYPVFEEK